MNLIGTEPYSASEDIGKVAIRYLGGAYLPAVMTSLTAAVLSRSSTMA